VEEIHTQDGVDTAVVFWIICDLGILSKDDFAASRNHSQLGYIHLYNGTLGHDAKLGVHGRLRVFLDANDLQLEGGLQIRCTSNTSGSEIFRRSVDLTMSDVGLFVPEGHRSNKAFHLDWLSRKGFANKRGFGHQTFPRLGFALPGLDNLEHLVLGYPADLR
jgi:hypothetical protein